MLKKSGLGTTVSFRAALVTSLLYFFVAGSKEECDKEEDKELDGSKESEGEEGKELQEKGDESSDTAMLPPKAKCRKKSKKSTTPLGPKKTGRQRKVNHIALCSVHTYVH